VTTFFTTKTTKTAPKIFWGRTLVWDKGSFPKKVFVFFVLFVVKLFEKIAGARMIRKLAAGGYRLYSKKKNPKTGKRRNLGTFRTRAAAEQHERAVQFFKRRG
jgi:hypothetical protein